MARRDFQDIEKEIQRIEGQLIVAKQICRENLKEINQLKKQQENDFIRQETNRLLSISSLDCTEHADQFNKLLQLVYEEQSDTLDKTIQYNEEKEKNEQYQTLLFDLSSNVTQLESLFDYAKTLFTQPIQSINTLNNTISLQNITDDCSIISMNHHQEKSIEIHDLQKRIDIMQKKFNHIHQCDDCLIQ